MTYFVEGFDPTAKRALLLWARDDFDRGDRFGWAMSWLFDICDELCRRDEGAETLARLQYSPGALGSEESEDRGEGLRLMSTDALEYSAAVLERVVEDCKRRGEGY